MPLEESRRDADLGHSGYVYFERPRNCIKPMLLSTWRSEPDSQLCRRITATADCVEKLSASFRTLQNAEFCPFSAYYLRDFRRLSEKYRTSSHKIGPSEAGAEFSTQSAPTGHRYTRHAIGAT